MWKPVVVYVLTSWQRHLEIPMATELVCAAALVGAGALLECTVAWLQSFWVKGVIREV